MVRAHDIHQSLSNIVASRGLVWAVHCNERSGARRLNWPAIEQGKPGPGLLWLHLDLKDKVAQAWLQEQSGLDEIICEALLAKETRPRALHVDDALLLILYTVNVNKGEEPTNMIALRIWLDGERVISLRNQRLQVASDLIEQITISGSPHSTGDWLAEITSRITEHIGAEVIELEETLDTLELKMLDATDRRIQNLLNRLRRQVLTVRRYLAPQRDVIVRLAHEHFTWLTDDTRTQLNEAADRLIRYVEDLDLIRERVAIIETELVTLNSEQMNRSMVRLAVITTIFLPLTFITGLLGINVGGIPGANHALGFLMVCAIVVVLAILELIFLYWTRWL